MPKPKDIPTTLEKIRQRSAERKVNRKRVGAGKRAGRPRNDKVYRPSASDDVDTLLGIVDTLTK